MPLHPAWVKNISRRVLWAALEPDISKDDRHDMEQYFGQKCAYCERPLGERWHADHLLSVDSGGFNHISNRVPACPKCNEHEKREMQWEAFLQLKCGTDTNLLAERKTKIQAWAELKKPATPPVTAAQREAWKREIGAVAEAIDQSWKRLKGTSTG